MKNSIRFYIFCIVLSIGVSACEISVENNNIPTKKIEKYYATEDIKIDLQKEYIRLIVKHPNLIVQKEALNIGDDALYASTGATLLFFELNNLREIVKKIEVVMAEKSYIYFTNDLRKTFELIDSLSENQDQVFTKPIKVFLNQDTTNLKKSFIEKMSFLGFVDYNGQIAYYFLVRCLDGRYIALVTSDGSKLRVEVLKGV